MGVIIMTAGLLDLLLKKFFKGIRLEHVFISVAVVLAVLFSLETYRSTKVWLNENTLFTHLAEKSPSRVVFVRLGLVNMELQNSDKAQAAFLRAVEYDDRNWEAWYGLSVIARHRKDYIATLKYLNNAKRCDAVDMGAYALIFNDIGNIYYLKKDYARAKEFYLEAKSKDSTYREVVYNLARVCQLMGDEDEAAGYIELLKTLVMPAHGDQKSRMRMYMVK
jgi:tetratricopeptide (TPR) repeat protein